jgi:hypothetical protein
MCKAPEDDERTTHRQLMSEFIGYKFMKHVANDPTIKVKLMMGLMHSLYRYKVKYGKT